MTRGGRIRYVDNEEKVMEPLFPRIHLNDIEEGRPRAPPRSKIALCEQLSRPSQELNSEGPSELPSEHHVISRLAASASSSQAGGQGKVILSPFIIPSAPAHSLKKVLSHFSGGMDLNTTRTLLKRQSTEDTNHEELNISGNFSLTTAESSGPVNNSSSLKIFNGKTVRDEYAYRVSNYAQTCLATNSKMYQYGGEREKPTRFPMFPGLSTVAAADIPTKRKSATFNSFSMQLQSTNDVILKQANAMDLKQRQHARYPVQQKSRETVAQKFFFQNSASELPNGEGTGQPAQYSGISLSKEHQSGSINEKENGWSLQEAKAQLLPNNANSNDTTTEPRCLTGNAASVRGTISRVQSESDFGAIFGNSHGSPKKAGNCHEETEGKAYRSLQLREADRDNDVSDSSMIDSLSGLYPSPDVVGLIGEKHFWKAREAIINQQRIFAVQVFELHILIRVQKLIAISPHLFLECYPSRGRPSTKEDRYKKLHVIKSQRQNDKTKDDSQKPSQSTDCPKSAIGKTAPHTPSGIAQISGYGHHPGDPPSLVPMAAKNNDSGWCFHLPWNQWLVPVISPSSGLVYKSYSGPCPPSSGDMAPVYGGCNPMNLPLVPAYGLQASHQQPGVVVSGDSATAPNYFPPYGMLVMNPVVSPPDMEQVNSLSGSHGAQPHEIAEPILTGRVHSNMKSGISYNISSCCIQKIPSYSEVQGSTASSSHGPSSEVQGSTSRSPCGRGQRADHGRDALPLFPTAPGFGQY